MFTYKKIPEETINQKIKEYEATIKFYKANSQKRFQNKNKLEKISQEIKTELSKNHTNDNLKKLLILNTRIDEL